jgi:Uncharacterised protein conserved in bacteria (DUF2336)
MLAALDALIQNGPAGRGPIVLRQLCALFLKFGVDAETSTTVLFDEVMANVAADLDNETLRNLAPQMGMMANVLPAFAATVTSRSHELQVRVVQDTEHSAEVAIDDVQDVAIPMAPVSAAEAAQDIASDKSFELDLAASMASSVPPEVSEPLSAMEPELTAQPAFSDRRAARRDPVEDAENPITLARKASMTELLQIAGLPDLPEGITNVLIARGNRDILQRVLENSTASFSKSSLTTLAELAPSDRMIKESLIARVDLPEPIVERLLPFLSPEAKARTLMAGQPFGEQEARNALTQAASDLVAAYRNGNALMGLDTCQATLDEGKMSVNEVICLLARDVRVAELASFMANRLDIRHLTAFNILSGRLDHSTAVLIRAMDGDMASMDGVMIMRRRCGCRDAKETRSAFSTAQRYTVDAARILIRQMDKVDQGDAPDVAETASDDSIRFAA